MPHPFRRIDTLRLGVLALLAACSASEPPRATTVQISLPVATVLVGETQQASAQVFDQNGDVFATSESPTWTATPASRAAVSTAGVLTAIAPGTVELTASMVGLTETILVEIAGPFALELTLETDGSGPPVAGQAACAYTARISASGGRGIDFAVLTGITFAARSQSGAVNVTTLPSAAINDPALTDGESKTLRGVNQSSLADPTVELGVVVEYQLAERARSLNAIGPC